MDAQIASLEADGAKKNKGHIEALIQERRVHVDRLKEQFDKQASMLDGKDSITPNSRASFEEASTRLTSGSAAADKGQTSTDHGALARVAANGGAGAGAGVAAAVEAKSGAAAGQRSAEEELEVMSLVRDLEVRREECVRTRV